MTLLPEKRDVPTTMLDSFAIGVATDIRESRTDVIFQLGDNPDYYALTVEGAEEFVKTMQECIKHIKGDKTHALH